MDKKIKSIVNDAKVKLQYENLSISEVLEELDDTISTDYGINLKFVPAETTSDNAEVDLTEMLTYLSLLGTDSGHHNATAYLRTVLLNGKGFQSNMQFTRNVGAESLQTEGFLLGEIITQSLNDIKTISTGTMQDITATRKRFKNVKFTTLNELESSLVRTINLPIPLTDKRIKIIPKTLTEITLTIKEFLKMVSLFGTLVLLLEKRITDWVLLKGALFIVWGYIFWLLANEIFHIKIIDASENEQQALERFRSHFLNMKNEVKVTTP